MQAIKCGVKTQTKERLENGASILGLVNNKWNPLSGSVLSADHYRSKVHWKLNTITESRSRLSLMTNLMKGGRTCTSRPVRRVCGRCSRKMNQHESDSDNRHALTQRQNWRWKVNRKLIPPWMRLSKTVGACPFSISLSMASSGAGALCESSTLRCWARNDTE